MAYDPARDTATALNGTNAARGFAAVTPSNTVDFVRYPRGLYVGGGGDVAVVPLSGDADTAVTFVGVAAGTILPIGARRVNVTGTTATDIVALY